MKYKKTKKIMSLILICVMIFTGIRFQTKVYSADNENNKIKTEENSKAPKKQIVKKEKRPKVVKELEDLRTADSSTYLLSDGSKRLELYGADIRYKENGKYVDYDQTLKKISKTCKSKLKKTLQKSKISNEKNVEEYVYENTAGDSKQYFPKKIDAYMGIVMEKDSHIIHFAPIVEDIDNTVENSEQEPLEVKDNNITYTMDHKKIAYAYTSNPDSVKEEIILNEKPQTNVFSFSINMSDMKLKTVNYSKGIQIVDKKTKKVIAFISEPNIQGKDGKITYEEVEYQVEEDNGSYILNIVVDEEYLESAKYPVTIDPSISWLDDRMETATISDFPYSTSYNMKDTDYMQLQNECVPIGPYEGTHKYTYIDTGGITNDYSMGGNSERLESSQIQNATLSIKEYETNRTSISSPPIYFEFTAGTVEVRNIEGDWNPNTVTWENHPDMGDEILAEFHCAGVKLTEHKIDLTKWARDVVSRRIPNYGLALRAKETGTGDTFYSSKINYIKDENGNLKPTYMILAIDYRETDRYHGIPGVYSPSGNYSETSDDMSVQTILGNIPLSRTYNSLRYDKDAILGRGFHFNYEMKVTEGERGIVVEMPNGADWYFTGSSSSYYSDGNTGKLTKTDGKFKLVTLDMTEYGFNINGFLEYIKDSDGNELNISVDSGGKINSITDKSGTNIRFTYSGNLVKKIDEMKGSTILKSAEYTYSGNHLIKVKYPGGMERHYAYTNGRLSKVTDSGANNENPLKSIELTYYTDGKFEGMVKTTTDSIGVKSTYNYDFEGKLTTINDVTSAGENVRSMKETYNDSLAITKVEDLKNNTNNQVEEVKYEDSDTTDPDRPVSSKDQYGNLTQYEYDANGNLTKTIYPDNSTEISIYDQDINQVIKHTDRNGLVTDNTYNEDGMITKTMVGGVRTASYMYYPESTYGVAGLLQSETDIRGNVTQYTYDNKGNVLTTNDIIGGVNHITTNTYDTQGRLTKTIDSNGICTENIYSSSGAVIMTKVSDSIGGNLQITRTVHDVLGRVIQVINPMDYNASIDNIDVDRYGNANVGVRTEYNGNGQVIKEKDAMGNATSYEYDADGNVIKEIKPDGSYSICEYDKDGRKTRESFYDNVNKTTTLLKLITYSEVKNETKTKEYLTDEMVAVTIEELDWEGNVVKRTEPNNSVQTSRYTKGLLMREENSNGSWTEYAYDKWGHMTMQTSSFDDTGSSITKYHYNIYGNVYLEEEKNNAARQPEEYSEKKYEYDSRNNLVCTYYYSDNRLKKISQSYYSWDNKLLREYKGMTSPLTIKGLDDVENPYNQNYTVMKYEYDSMGRLGKKTNALGKVETYEYDKEGREVLKKDKKGITHRTEYNSNGDVIRTNSGGIIKNYTYDKGRVVSENEDNIVTNYTYDGRGNCITEKSGDVLKTYTYNLTDMETGCTITIGNEQKQKVTKEYNTMGNLAAVYENGLVKARYTYDDAGQLIKTSNANGTVEENTYNLAGLVTSTINKKGCEVVSQYSYTYYYDGNERSKTDKNGTTLYQYDDLGQLTKEVTTKRAADNTTLDKAAGLIVEIPEYVEIGTSGQIRYYAFTSAVTDEYTIESTGNCGDPVAELYNADGTKITGDDDGGAGLNFKINATLTANKKYIIGVKAYSGKCGSTIMLSQRYREDNTRAEAARMIQENVSLKAEAENNEKKYYSFAATTSGVYTIQFSQYSTINTTLYTTNNVKVSGPNTGDFKVGLSAGQIYILSVNISAGNDRFMVIPPTSNKYDMSEYKYDIFDNRVKYTEVKSGNISDTVYTYDADNKMLSKKTDNQNKVTYSYDDNGNMTYKSDGTTQTFDALNRMITYKSKDNVTTTYTYYIDDTRRSKKTGTSDEIIHIWNDSDIVLDLKDTAIQSSYVYGEKLVCGAYGWYLYNAHGDVTALTDNYGSITKDYDYSSFGVQKTNIDENDKNPYRYCGEYYDFESGYTYLQARYYDADTGRFISEDPALDGDNWYVYCGNDPVNMSDPTGMWGGKIHEEITLAAFNAVKGSLKHTKGALAFLLKGCVDPDKNNRGNGNGKWHGHGKYINIMQDQLSEAKKIWGSKKKNKYKNAYFQIGRGLHTIQDFYAHNVLLKGKRVSSREAANGSIHIKNNKNIWGTHPQYISNLFMLLVKSYRHLEGKKDTPFMHAYTADNPNAYFNGRTWIFTMKSMNKRYQDAIKESKKYLKTFSKVVAGKAKIRKLKELKIRI